MRVYRIAGQDHGLRRILAVGGRVGYYRLVDRRAKELTHDGLAGQATGLDGTCDGRLRRRWRRASSCSSALAWCGSPARSWASRTALCWRPWSSCQPWSTSCCEVTWRSCAGQEDGPPRSLQVAKAEVNLTGDALIRIQDVEVRELKGGTLDRKIDEPVLMDMPLGYRYAAQEAGPFQDR